MKSRIKTVVPNLKLVNNNSPSFNWILNFYNEAYLNMIFEGGNNSSGKEFR
jgi:isocitrate lyase